MPRTIVRVAVLAVVTLGLSSASTASDTRYKVIVHPKNPVASIDRDYLRNIFLKKESDWNRGETIRPVDLSAKFVVRDEFTHDVLRKTPAQLRSYWNQQIFSGKGVPPPEASSPREVVAYVLANPGAVGYIPADVDSGEAKVVEVR